MVIITDHYDVFLSFRGGDTRQSFLSHLRRALTNANLTIFYDDHEIETGEPLKPELESAIKSSRASIIVLSENYASSTWCLEELVLILEQKKNSDQIVIPIFYDVEPTHVRKQESTFGVAIATHERKMREENDAVRKSQWAQKIELWKRALTEVADLKGENVKDRLEADFLDEIVKKVYHRLRTNLPPLIGMGNSVKYITDWIKDGSSHTGDVLTILGIGGIGKTALAQHLLGLHCHEYTKIFIGDISRKCAQPSGLLGVQKQLCEDILRASSVQVHVESEYTSMIENALARKKLLLVLDDVDSLGQLDGLLGKRGLHSGSKVIITTTYASLVERCELFHRKVKPMYKECRLKGLSEDASLQLLCLHAFKCNHPNKEYKEMSIELSRYCEGHPLTLEYLGKSLHNQGVHEWEDRIERLKKEPDSRIDKTLRTSFDSLTSNSDKRLFKHIACFFVGSDRDFTETILKACSDINPRSGIKNLIDKCLLSIGSENKLMMHQLIQDMGRNLVREESERPWERSRIWCHKESFDVLKRKKGTDDILGLTLDIRALDGEKLNGSFELDTDALSKMDSLMLLQLNYVQMTGSYENFPKELRWLCMHGFPLKSIPPDLPMENLVILDMSYSNIESFGAMYYGSPQPPSKKQKTLPGSCSNDQQLLGSLKILVLSFCEKLCSVGGFFKLPALERLIVRNCESLIKVCQSIEHCVELVVIDLSNCKKLKNLPALRKLKKLKMLIVDGCDLHELPVERRDVESSSAIVETSPVISLPSSIVILSLVNNNLYNESFPADFSSLSKLKYLYIVGNPIVSMPSCVRTLPRLEKLSMGNCKVLQIVDHPPSTLTALSLESTSGYKPSLQKIVFDPKMSSLSLLATWNLLATSSFEIEGMVKIQPMATVEETVLHSLGWTDLEFIKERTLETSCHPELETSKTQMYYEFGIFSTIYGGESMPNWIEHKISAPSIYFTVPSSHKKLRGLNFCYMHRFGSPLVFKLPNIRIHNITKHITWIYNHYINSASVNDEDCLIFLSHWMFGRNQMEGGDHITVTVTEEADQVTTECGIGFVYDDEPTEEDPLGYYKSWNHILGGDLYAFQVSGRREYNLHYMRFFYGYSNTLFGEFSLLTPDNFHYRERRVLFKAFSKRRLT